jgi:hypothetical protein
MFTVACVEASTSILALSIAMVFDFVSGGVCSSIWFGGLLDDDISTALSVFVPSFVVGLEAVVASELHPK